MNPRLFHSSCHRRMTLERFAKHMLTQTPGVRITDMVDPALHLDLRVLKELGGLFVNHLLTPIDSGVKSNSMIIKLD